jgi:hypothetical protein
VKQQAKAASIPCARHEDLPFVASSQARQETLIVPRRLSLFRSLVNHRCHPCAHERQSLSLRENLCPRGDINAE